MKTKSLTALIAILALILAFASCNADRDKEPESAPDETSSSQEQIDEKLFTVGIDQFASLPELNAATRGFKEVLTLAFGDRVVFDERNAGGDAEELKKNAVEFAGGGYDLILASSAPALRACANATDTIPVIGVCVADYASALDLDDFTGTVGGNVTGTSDLPPLEAQAAMVKELVPSASSVGVVYCSGETDSVFQAEKVKELFEKAGLKAALYPFEGVEDVASAVKSACGGSDALFIPSGITTGACGETIANTAMPSKKPVIAGDDTVCSACGVAALCVDRYELGRAAGEMAVKILKGEIEAGEIPVGYSAAPVKKYNPTNCAALGIKVPEGYSPIEG